MSEEDRARLFARLDDLDVRLEVAVIALQAEPDLCRKILALVEAEAS